MSSDMDKLRKAAGVLDTVLEIGSSFCYGKSAENWGRLQVNPDFLQFDEAARAFGVASDGFDNLRARLQAELAEMEGNDG